MYETIPLATDVAPGVDVLFTKPALEYAGWRGINRNNLQAEAKTGNS